MIIDKERDAEFIRLIEFLLSFDFDYKDIVRKQIETSIVDMVEKSDYAIAFRFYVDALYDSLPFRFWCWGLPVTVEVVNGDYCTSCELFCKHGYIVEYRLYNIDATPLDMEKFWQGTPQYKKVTGRPPWVSPGDEREIFAGWCGVAGEEP